MRKLKTALVFISLAALVFLRYQSSQPGFKNGDIIRISTTVYSEPQKFSTSYFLKISGLKIYLPLVPEINYGNKIVVEGKVENDKLTDAKLVRINPGGVTSRFRNDIITFYQKTLPEPYAGLLGGIVLGAKKSLSSDFYDLTKKTGVAHIVVASGTNITFVVAFLMGVLTLYLPRRKTIPLVLLGVILYLLISGFEAPLIRAAVMSFFLLFGQEVGKVTSTPRIFLMTMIVMLLVNPFWITDVGFWLSFASTAALLMFEGRIKAKLKRVPNLIREDLSTSLAAQIGVAPILFVVFRQFNILSPLVNVLVLWTVAPLMVIGVVGGVLGLTVPALGKIVLLLGYPLLWWFTYVVRIFA